jgi:uncharacterized membrane protein YjjP (DUF1212 family)
MAIMGFYTLDLTSIVIILLISLTLFIFLNYMDKENEVNYIKNVSISISIGIISSILYSYLTIESDELLTSNYWD